MYRLVEDMGDTVAVPRLVFAKLTAPGASDARFKVALYMLEHHQADAGQIAQALHVRPSTVEQELSFWEGSGLLERQVQVAPPPIEQPQARRKMTTGEVTEAAAEDNVLGFLLEELQRIMGGVVSQNDINVFVTLYKKDGVPPDLLLLASTYAAKQKKYSVRYIEKMLLGWRRDGITDCEKADAYLKLLAERERREKKVAKMLDIPHEGLTLAERRRIAQWYEEFNYGKEMIEAARLAAGDKQNDIAYLTGILRKWHAKGYHTPRQMQQAGESRNIRVQGSQKSIAPEEDVLLNMTDYVPLRERRKR